MDFKIGVLLISAQICTTLALPPCTCTRNLNPVCGSDGVEYSNECGLQCAAYNSGTKITVAKHGPCEGSLPQVAVAEPCTCHLLYAPICGSDGKDYSNECALNCHKSEHDPSLKVEHPGPCHASVEPCTLILSPVCGSDGVTYGNSCLLNAAAKVKPGLSVSHDGPCADSVKIENLLAM